jgi:hypothetical protein
MENISYFVFLKTGEMGHTPKNGGGNSFGFYLKLGKCVQFGVNFSKREEE